MYQKAKKIMDEMLTNFEIKGISDNDIHTFYLNYQRNYWQRNKPNSSSEEIDRLANDSTLERLVDPKRKRIFEVIKSQINGRHNDFMCEFFAMYLQQQLEKEGIKSEVGSFIDHYVLLEDENWLFPGEEWGDRTCEELRPDHSRLFYLK
jgi:hypothetical protein